MSPAAPAEDFAAALREAMNRRSDMSNNAVAKAAGIDESHLRKLMRGGVEHPQPRTVKRLAQALGAPGLLAFTNGASRQNLRSQLQRTEEAANRALREVDELRREVERLRRDEDSQRQESR